MLHRSAGPLTNSDQTRSVILAEKRKFFVGVLGCLSVRS